MSKKKFSGNLNGKGYYIALILCAVAIGISGYLYYQSADNDNTSLEVPGGSDVQAVATQGSVTDPAGTAQTDPVRQPMKTAAPVAGQTIADYAVDCLSYNQTTRDWRTHDGVDIAAEAGTQVCAAADGTVYTVYDDDTMGTTVVIRHDNGYTTSYCSLDEAVSVSPGQSVAMGQAIGCVGTTALLETAIGEHVHFSVTCNGQSVDPADFLPTNE